MTAQHPTQSPPDYSVNEGSQKRAWWRRKRVWIPALVLVLLAVVGIIVGAVYGVRNSNSQDVQSDRDSLYAAGGGTSSSQFNQASHAATATPSAEAIDSDGPAETSSPEPSSSPEPILETLDIVPRDIGAAIGASSSLFWDLRAEGKLWKKEGGGPWEAYNDRQFLVVPVTVSTGENTQTAVSVEAVHGRMIYMHFHDSKWGEWQELEFPAQFRRRPAVISRAEGRVDVFNVDNDAHLWLVSYDGSAWSEWTELGEATNGEVAATSWGEDRIDVFAKYGDVINAPVRHKYWTAESGWAQEWENLGVPFSSGWYSGTGEGVGSISSPLAVSWCEAGGECVIDVVVNAFSTKHKIFRNGEWSDWLILYASHEGGEFPDTQSIVRGDGIDGRPFAHLISRGTDNCIHHNAHNGTGWGYWTYIQCEEQVGTNYPTEFLPTFAGSADGGNIEVMARDLQGNFLRYGFLGTPGEWVYSEGNSKWENLGHPD